MIKAKDEYMKFWNIPEEDLESEDFKQFELMDAYAEQVERERAIELIDGLRDYMHESHNNIAFDERTSEEFYEIFSTNEMSKEEELLKDIFGSEWADVHIDFQQKYIV